MAGPQHGIMGNDSGYGLDLPDMALENRDAELAEAAKKARFSKSQEYQEMRQWIEGRVEYLKHFQPGADGRDVALRDMSNDERGWRCLASDLMIHEWRSFLSQYDQAAEFVKSETARRKEA